VARPTLLGKAVHDRSNKSRDQENGGGIIFSSSIEIECHQHGFIFLRPYFVPQHVFIRFSKS
jgi:hypothetical protein